MYGEGTVTESAMSRHFLFSKCKNNSYMVSSRNLRNKGSAAIGVQEYIATEVDLLYYF